VQLSLFLPTARMLLTVTQSSLAACRQVVTAVSLRKFVLGVAKCRMWPLLYQVLFLMN